MTSEKQALLTEIRAELRAALERLSRAASEAHAAATDPGSKAEGKYDTRSLEASYLAAGQAKQVEELAAAVRTFGSLVLPDFGPEDAVDAGPEAEAIAAREEAARRVNAPYVIEGTRDENGVRPAHIKDRIRALGPTVRPDLTLKPADPKAGNWVI